MEPEGGANEPTKSLAGMSVPVSQPEFSGEFSGSLAPQGSGINLDLDLWVEPVQMC
jgi:hypothetical protein